MGLVLFCCCLFVVFFFCCWWGFFVSGGGSVFFWGCYFEKKIGGVSIKKGCFMSYVSDVLWFLVLSSIFYEIRHIQCVNYMRFLSVWHANIRFSIHFSIRVNIFERDWCKIDGNIWNLENQNSINDNKI